MQLFSSKKMNIWEMTTFSVQKIYIFTFFSHLQRVYWQLRLGQGEHGRQLRCVERGDDLKEEEEEEEGEMDRDCKSIMLGNVVNHTTLKIGSETLFFPPLFIYYMGKWMKGGGCLFPLSPLMKVNFA